MVLDRLWNGEYGAAVQLSRVLNLNVPGRWTDLGLRFSDETTNISAKSSASSLGCHSCCSSDARSEQRSLISKTSPHSSSTIEESKDRDVPPPKVLSPSRKFCSPDSIKFTRPPASTQNHLSSYSRSSSFLLPSSSASNHTERISSPSLSRYDSRGGLLNTTRSISGPFSQTYSRNLISPKQSSSKISLYAARTPSHFLRNRGSYHSIPTINIVPRQTIPSEHVPNVIPSSTSANYKGTSGSYVKQMRMTDSGVCFQAPPKRKLIRGHEPRQQISGQHHRKYQSTELPPRKAL